MTGGSNSNFLWILKSSLFFSTSKKLFASFAGHITSSSSNQSLSGKPNRCDYQQLAPDEDNNNGPDSKKNGKNKSENHRRFGSIDDDDDRSSPDDDSDQDDDDEEIDRLTCWVCERAFRCGTCDAIFPTLMALEAHQEEVDHWSSSDEDEDDDDDDDDDEDEDQDLSDDSQLDTEDEMELDRKDRQLKKERLFLI